MRTGIALEPCLIFLLRFTHATTTSCKVQASSKSHSRTILTAGITSPSEMLQCLR